MTTKLITLQEYMNLSPRTQGYFVYMQAEHDGSELRGLTNPYEKNTRDYMAWNAGAQAAAQDAQDSEE